MCRKFTFIEKLVTKFRGVFDKKTLIIQKVTLKSFSPTKDYQTYIFTQQWPKSGDKAGSVLFFQYLRAVCFTGCRFVNNVLAAFLRACTPLPSPEVKREGDLHRAGGDAPHSSSQKSSCRAPQRETSESPEHIGARPVASSVTDDCKTCSMRVNVTIPITLENLKRSLTRLQATPPNSYVLTTLSLYCHF